MREYDQATAWLWPAENGVNGLRVDTDSGIFHWYDAVGCACDTSLADQPMAAYRRQGIPAGIAPPPPDVLAEIDRLLTFFKL